MLVTLCKTSVLELVQLLSVVVKFHSQQKESFIRRPGCEVTHWSEKMLVCCHFSAFSVLLLRLQRRVWQTVLTYNQTKLLTDEHWQKLAYFI